MNTEYLKQYNKVLVIGHLTPDTDTITSSYILSKIFKSFGINSDYAVLETEKINSKTAKQLNEVMTYSPFILKESQIKNYHYFLVDHNDVSQSVKDASLVVGCIDHHPDSKQIPNAIIKDFCSTTLLIYDLFKDIYNFTDEDKKVIYMGALDDSACGFSPRYNDKAKKQILELGFDNYLKDKFEDYYIPTDLSDLDLAFNKARLKKYSFDDDINFKSTGIEAFDDNHKEEYKNFIKNQNENFLGLWLNYKTETSTVYLNYDHQFYQKDFNHIVSRGSEIIDLILNFIRSNK